MPSVFPFKKIDLVIDIKQYPNGRVAIQLLDSETGQVYAVASRNVPHIMLEEGEVLIKDMNENEGILDFLLKNNVVTDSGQVVCHGALVLNVCKLLPSEMWGDKKLQHDCSKSS